MTMDSLGKEQIVAFKEENPARENEKFLVKALCSGQSDTLAGQSEDCSQILANQSEMEKPGLIFSFGF